MISFVFTFPRNMSTHFVPHFVEYNPMTTALIYGNEEFADIQTPPFIKKIISFNGDSITIGTEVVVVKSLLYLQQKSQRLTAFHKHSNPDEVLFVNYHEAQAYLPIKRHGNHHLCRYVLVSAVTFHSYSEVGAEKAVRFFEKYIDKQKQDPPEWYISYDLEQSQTRINSIMSMSNILAPGIK